MQSMRANSRHLWWQRYAFIIGMCCCLACASCSSQGTTSSTQAASTGATVLPGQQIWQQGASSFLFGTNDTQEWAKNNVETSSSIQQALKDAHFTLMRTFFFDKSLADGHATTDAEIEQRLKTIENSGMTCLGVLVNISNVAFATHVVKYAGSRCNIYEFGNEPDYNGISINTYLKQWNTVIPMLRKINPQAKFIGPVTYNDQGNNGFMRAFLEGVKASGVLPDAISFHWYPCYNDSKESCLAKANSYGQVIREVKSMAYDVLGKDLPVGITEWNFDPGNPPPAYGEDTNFINQFTTQAIHSMAEAGAAFACQFDAASYSGYGHLDMFDVDTNQPKPQYYALKALIQHYLPAQTPGQSPTAASTAATTTTTTNTNTWPLISRGKPVYCSPNNQGPGGPQAIVNGHYGNFSFWRTNLSALPSWCALHIGSGPSRILLSWNSDYVFDYISNNGMSPQDYTISVSANSTNGADGTWQTEVSVVDNHTRIREHVLPFAGQSWVKLTVTRGQPQASQPYLTIDQIDVYDVSAAASLEDTYVFSGDSITVMAYNRFDANLPAYTDLVHTAFPKHFPPMLDIGLGGWNSEGAAQDIGLWLSLNPDMHYWLLGWGTNDALEQVPPAQFKANMQTVITSIKQAGHIPVLAHIPYIKGRGASMEQEIQALNAAIDQLTTSNGLMAGPDFYSLFQSHASTYLLSDGIHPTPAGAIAMNQAWFQALRTSVYGG
ncbi:MAG TPA: GDSL-type esterase/lipase family protein [Ktedonobacteraceae bacterium]|nr:GDSL-type esterase/lipase family protein [Ktedonobacteraceae bacterium]